MQRSALRWCWLSIIIIGLDQLTKWWMNTHLLLYVPQPITPFFNLTLMHNTGAAFSFLHDSKGAIYLFSAIALLVSGVILYYLRTIPATQRWKACGLALILGGAVGNVIDRLVYGYVVDFFDFYLRTWHFAAFNVADAAISVGVILLIGDAVLDRQVKTSSYKK